MTDKLILPFRGLDLRDHPAVGGKNADLGELIQRLAASGVRVPDGFALTADAFRRHLAENRLDVEIYAALDRLDVSDVAELARTAQGIRDRISRAPLPRDIEAALLAAYAALSDLYREAAPDVAVRSSATAEDLPGASFAGPRPETVESKRVAPTFELFWLTGAARALDLAAGTQPDAPAALDEVC